MCIYYSYVKYVSGCCRIKIIYGKLEVVDEISWYIMCIFLNNFFKVIKRFYNV